MSKRTDATRISAKVYKIVKDRDDNKCIRCGRRTGIQVAHYISRGRSGLGIPENLVCLCLRCHDLYDNGKYHDEIKELIEDYLRSHYNDWDHINLVYDKWRI